MPNWPAWCHQPDLVVDPSGVLVQFRAPGLGTEQPSRSHRVAVDVAGDSVELCGVVLREAAWNGLPLQRQGELLRQIGIFNRRSVAVGCRLAPGLGLVAMAHLPLAGLEQGEFVQMVRHVAAHADRLEFWLTAEDSE